MAETMRSSIMYKNYVYDSRALAVSCFFHRLSREAAEALTMNVADWLCNLYDENYVVDWTLITRRLKSKVNFRKKLALELEKKDDYWYFNSDGFVRSELISNQAQLAQQRRELLEIRDFSIGPQSYDYPKYWNELFPDGMCSDSEFLERIIRLHNEPQKFHIGERRYRDVFNSFSVKKYPNSNNWYSAHFYFEISSFCLPDSLDSFSEMLLDFLKDLSSRFINMNGFVMLQPNNSPHMWYFGRDKMINAPVIEAGFTEDEVYYAYYLNGVEWANIISPLARGRIPDLNPESEVGNGIHIEDLKGGALLVKSNTPISKFDIDDLRPMKILLYDALYPGMSIHSIQELFCLLREDFFPHHPRSNWQNIPILDGEIDVIDGALVYQHLSRKNV